jgi:hypothetical protein
MSGLGIVLNGHRQKMDVFAAEKLLASCEERLARHGIHHVYVKVTQHTVIFASRNKNAAIDVSSEVEGFDVGRGPASAELDDFGAVCGHHGVSVLSLDGHRVDISSDTCSIIIAGIPRDGFVSVKESLKLAASVF